MKFQDGIGKMKNLSNLTPTTIVVCLGIALAIPLAAPADPVVGQVSAPVVKTKRVVPVAKRMNTPVTRRVDTPPLALQNFATEAPAEACVYDDDYSTGANNNGTTFCSKKLGYQDLPPERQGRISAANVPEGYVLVLYSGLGQTGLSCRLVGPNAGVVPTCNNMARGILLERNVGAARAAQQADARRQEQESLANANGDGAAWAASVKAQQEAAAAEEAARQAAHDARAAEEREALSRMRQRDRQEADARDAAAALERQRVAAEEAARAASAAKLAVIVDREKGCLVTVGSSDWKMVVSDGRERCVNASMPYVGDAWNDDIETVRFLLNFAQGDVAVTLYEHANYQGRSLRLICGRYELIDDVENEVSSIKIEILPAFVNCRDMGRDGETLKVYDWDQ
jgi:hypothetical protein